MSKKKDFLKDVQHEIDMLRKHATKEEKEFLNIERFNYRSPENCVYGQMTGDCSSKRAKKLMDISCIRVLHLEDGVDDIAEATISEPRFKVNGEYTAQMWYKGNSWIRRNYSFLSALEGYICTKGANIEGIMAYIKEETDTVKL